MNLSPSGGGARATYHFDALDFHTYSFDHASAILPFD